MRHRIGVCTWSLQPNSIDDLIEKVRAAGVSCVQLALDPLGTPEWPIERMMEAFRAAGIDVRSGMMRTKGEDYSTLETIRRTGGVRLDENWADNLANAKRCGKIAREIGVTLVSFHAGFLPPERRDPLRDVMVERLRATIDALAEFGVRAAFETGQETAETLLECLEQLDRPAAGVNFDPANMILYDHGDPVDSLRKLAPRVLQIHIKDAVRTKSPETWGTETPVGEGQVDWGAFFDAVAEGGVECDLMIEREAGGRRLEEIRQARTLVERMLDPR